MIIGVEDAAVIVLLMEVAHDEQQGPDFGPLLTRIRAEFPHIPVPPWLYTPRPDLEVCPRCRGIGGNHDGSCPKFVFPKEQPT
jgi:hypothetical protein